MCCRRKEEEHTNLNEMEYGICGECSYLFELREEKRIDNGNEIMWLCPKCYGVTNEKIMEKKMEWELTYD